MQVDGEKIKNVGSVGLDTCRQIMGGICWSTVDTVQFFSLAATGRAGAQAPTIGTRGRTSAGFRQTRKARPTPETQGAKTSWPVGAGGWPAGWWLAASGCGSPSLPTPLAAGSPARNSIPCATCRSGLVRGQRAAAIAFARERACVRAVTGHRALILPLVFLDIHTYATRAGF